MWVDVITLLCSFVSLCLRGKLFSGLLAAERPIHIRAPVAVELPVCPHLADLIEVEVGDDQFILLNLTDGNAAKLH